MSTVRIKFTIDGSLANVTSVVLSDPTGAFGLKRNDTDAVVVADGTAMTNITTGIYEHTFDDPADNLEYTYWIEWIYDGATLRNEYTVNGPLTTIGRPVSLAEARLHLKVDTTDDDELISQLLDSATVYCEQFQNRTYLNRTRFLYLDAFPDEIIVPDPPLVSVTSLQYIDTDGATQTWDASNYRVDTSTEPGTITRAYNIDWPSIRSVTSAITITYVAGYGALATNTPDDVKNAIKLLIGHWYENREGVSELNMKEVPLAIKSLLWAERII